MLKNKSNNYNKKFHILPFAFLICISFCITLMNVKEIHAANNKYKSVVEVSNTLIAKGNTMSSYIDGVNSQGEWRYGRPFDYLDWKDGPLYNIRSITLAEKYCVLKEEGKLMLNAKC